MLAPSSSPHCLLVFERRHKKADGKLCVQTGFTKLSSLQSGPAAFTGPPLQSGVWGLFSWAGQIPRETLFWSPLRRTSAQLLMFWGSSGGKGWSAPSSGHPLPCIFLLVSVPSPAHRPSVSHTPPSPERKCLTRHDKICFKIQFSWKGEKHPNTSIIWIILEDKKT